MRGLKFAILILAGLLLSACASLGDLVRKPEVSVISVTPVYADFQRIDLEMELLVKNPNPVEIRLEGFDYSLSVDGAALVSGDQTEGIELEAEGRSSFTVPLSLDYGDLYKAIGALGDEKESAYRIDTGFRFMLPLLGEQRLALSYEGTVPHIRLPSFSFGDLEVTRLNLTGADIRAVLRVSNPNGFDLSLKGMDAALEVNGIPWTELRQSRDVTVYSGRSEELSFDFSLDFVNMGRLVYKLITGEDRVSYDLKGGLRLGSSLPFFAEAGIPLSLTGSADLKR